MLQKGATAAVEEIELETARDLVKDGFTSVISHEVTAKVVSAVLHTEVVFNRVNVTLKAGDVLVAVIPSFRAEIAREFTEEEVCAAPLRCFLIKVA